MVVTSQGTAQHSTTGQPPKVSLRGRGEHRACRPYYSPTPTPRSRSKLRLPLPRTPAADAAAAKRWGLDGMAEQAVRGGYDAQDETRRDDSDEATCLVVSHVNVSREDYRRHPSGGGWATCNWGQARPGTAHQASSTKRVLSRR